MKVELSEQEWSQVIAIVAQTHPLVAKISQQLVVQRQGNSHAAEDGRPEGGVREHPGTLPSRFETAESPTDYRNRGERSSQR
jgi:hypothetical protein